MIELIKALNDYGPWAIVAALMYSQLSTARYIKSLHEYIGKMHEEMRDDNREAVTALIETRESMHAFRDGMERLTDVVKEKKHVEMAQSGGSRQND